MWLGVWIRLMVMYVCINNGNCYYCIVKLLMFVKGNCNFVEFMFLLVDWYFELVFESIWFFLVGVIGCFGRFVYS